MTRQDQYCNAQSFERSVKIAPIKCRKTSMIKAISGVSQVRLHRTIPMRAPGNANPRLPPILVASVRQVGTPTAIDAGSWIASPNARALLPVAGRW